MASLKLPKRKYTNVTRTASQSIIAVSALNISGPNKMAAISFFKRRFQMHYTRHSSSTTEDKTENREELTLTLYSDTWGGNDNKDLCLITK